MSFSRDAILSRADLLGPPVIDARAPRFNQAVIGAAALAAWLLGFWPLLTLAALQLALTLTFGPRLCLACILYFKLVRPRLGPGPVKDARPVRFANVVGLVFLSAATVAHLAGFSRLGWTLGLLVAALALLAATTGLCVGCELYRLLARLRGIGPRRVTRIDLQEIGASPQPGLVVQFTHPRCSDCHTLEERLSSQGVPLALVDVTRFPALARKYGISLVPLAFKVDADGRVLA
ncbi:MAG TPA: DUF4395 family protein, partial [Polyangia bacterium]